MERAVSYVGKFLTSGLVGAGAYFLAQKFVEDPLKASIAGLGSGFVCGLIYLIRSLNAYRAEQLGRNTLRKAYRNYLLQREIWEKEICNWMEENGRKIDSRVTRNVADTYILLADRLWGRELQTDEEAMEQLAPEINLRLLRGSMALYYARYARQQLQTLLPFEVIFGDEKERKNYWNEVFAELCNLLDQGFLNEKMKKLVVENYMRSTTRILGPELYSKLASLIDEDTVAALSTRLYFKLFGEEDIRKTLMASVRYLMQI